MITAVEGRPGMGKSVYLVGVAYQKLLSNYYVFSNIEIAVPARLCSRYQYYQSFDDLLPVRLKAILIDNPKIRGIIIIMDEMQVYLSSRNWDKLDQKFQLLLQQHRKRGIDIFGATQSIKRADVVFRELVQRFYRIAKIISFKIPYVGSFGFFYLREYDPDSIESASRAYDAIGWPFLYFADPVVLRLYDTTQEYQLDDPIGRREVKTIVYEQKTVVVPRVLSTQRVESVVETQS